MGLRILTACEGRGHGNDIFSSVATSQRTHLVSTTKTGRLLLCTEIIVVYCKNHVEHKCVGKYIIIQILKYMVNIVTALFEEVRIFLYERVGVKDVLNCRAVFGEEEL